MYITCKMYTFGSPVPLYVGSPFGVGVIGKPKTNVGAPQGCGYPGAKRRFRFVLPRFCFLFASPTRLFQQRPFCSARVSSCVPFSRTLVVDTSPGSV